MATTSWNDLLLNNGGKLPAIGLGTDRMKTEVINEAIDEALSLGYRLFDTGVLYGNGNNLVVKFRSLLEKHGLDRENIYVISKLRNCELGDKTRVLHAYQRCIELLDLEYLDLCLVQCSPEYQLKAIKKEIGKPIESTWAGLVDLYDEGLVSAIGVSNYSVDRLTGILNSRRLITPVVNQVELNPLKYDKQLLSFCEQNEIAVQGFHSLGGVDSQGALLKLPQVKSIAKDLDVTPAQVLLVWSLQKGCGVVPKSANKEHIKENFNLKFKLNDEHMATLDSLSKTNEKPPKRRRFNSRRKT